MKTAQEIFKEAEEEILRDGNQSLKSIGILSTQKAAKEMFIFLYEESQLDENKNLSLSEFFNKMESLIL